MLKSTLLPSRLMTWYMLVSSCSLLSADLCVRYIWQNAVPQRLDLVLARGAHAAADQRARVRKRLEEIAPRALQPAAERFEINDVLQKRNTSYSIGNMRCFFKFIRLSRAFVLMERVRYAKIKRCIEKTIWGRKYIIFLLFVV